MINKEWDIILKDELQADYFKNLGIFVKSEYKNKIVYPEYERIFDAFRYTDYDKVKVVAMPPSLRNIFKELESDIGVKRTQTDLTDWAKQGILLLNSIMTVVKDSPLSHKDKGWETFTDNVIRILGKREKPIVFILWGNYARSKKALIENPNHKIIESVHPSPLSASRGFLGSKPFSKTNLFLEKNGIEGIRW